MRPVRGWAKSSSSVMQFPTEIHIGEAFVATVSVASEWTSGRIMRGAEKSRNLDFRSLQTGWHKRNMRWPGF
jgi:hypothetical protein